MATVITHFYNEEYLLPRWLEHHKKYFTNGVLIDYASTDNSVAICREICPTWQIFQSGFPEFDAANCDYEVMFYERQMRGWRIALTVTEFLVGDPLKLMFDTEARVQWYIPGIRFTKWDPDGILDDRPLWEQITTGVSPEVNPIAHSCRSLHNFNDINYKNADGSATAAGRHYNPPNTYDAMIFHYAHCIVGEPMLKRRLQVQHKVSLQNRREGLGTHHYFDAGGLNRENLYQMHHQFIAQGESDCSSYINRVIK